jgi:hypothetical protein
MAPDAGIRLRERAEPRPAMTKLPTPAERFEVERPQYLKKRTDPIASASGPVVGSVYIRMIASPS